MSGRGKYHGKRKPTRGGGHKFTPARRLAASKADEESGMWGEPREKEEEENDSSVEDSGDAKEAINNKELIKKQSDSDTGSESESDEDENSSSRKAKSSTQGIIEVENPNRVKKDNLKASEISTEPREMTRREREAAEKAASRQRYLKMHAEGKTDQAKADLARLAVIRQQREEAAQQRKAEAEAKAADQKAKIEKEGRKGKKP
ncbi:hypothetical protein G9A89_002462 [Geosiphon pyriformis]|nr:hypothetical protein G9A89_002462 [Geosiphon pyriformis]